MLSSQQHRWGKQSQLGLLMLNWLQYICNSICLVKRLKALVKFTYLGGTGMFDCSLCNGSNCISGTSVAYRNKNEYEMRCSWRNDPIPRLQVTLIYLPANAGVSVAVSWIAFSIYDKQIIYQYLSATEIMRMLIAFFEIPCIKGPFIWQIRQR